jgi:type IV pilus assembly protein PilE
MTRNSTRRAAHGFTLLELMIAVTIVGILAAIAIPSYSQYVRKGNRTDATRALLSDAQALQRCYSQNFTYTPAAPCTPPAGTSSSPGGYYNVTVALQATSYTLTAVAIKAPQTQDTTCQTFILTSAGAQTAQTSGSTDSTVACWGTK